MQAIKRFPKCEDVYKDIVKKLVPKLADRDDFEAEYQYKLPCSSCREETAIGLFYRILNQEDWYAASETMECSVCRDREAFNVNQSKSLEELRASISERLTNEYFLLPEDLMDAGFKISRKLTMFLRKLKRKLCHIQKCF